MIEESQRYQLVYTPLAFSKNTSFLERLKESFPVEIPFIEENGLTDDQRAALDTYIYISDDGGFDNIFNKMSRKHPQVNFTALGRVSGKEIVKLLARCQAEVRDSIRLGHYKITTGQFRNLHVDVVGHEGDQAICQYELLKEIKTMTLPISSLEPCEPLADPTAAFMNLQERAMASGDKNAIIVDGNLCLYRNIFGYNTMYTKKTKRFIGGCHGFYFSMLKLKQLYPEYEIHVIFDGYDAAKFEENPEYKTGRFQYSEKFKESFRDNRAWCKSLVTAVGFHLYHLNDKEGDDVIGALAHRLTKKEGYSKVLVYSTDTDFYSLVDEQIELLVSKQTFRGHTELVAMEEARDKFGVNENYKINWFRAFAGDSSDTIWSVNKFYKINKELITRFEGKDYLPIINEASTVEELKALALAMVHPKTGAPFWPEFIEDGQFDRNLKLLTINTDLMDVYPTLDEFKKPFDDAGAQALLEEVSFFKELEQWSRVSRVFQSIW